MDGPERHRQRPPATLTHQAHDSGKKQPQADKHLRLVNANTGQVG
jgi:hypothetical protein